MHRGAVGTRAIMRHRSLAERVAPLLLGVVASLLLLVTVVTHAAGPRLRGAEGEGREARSGAERRVRNVRAGSLPETCDDQIHSSQQARALAAQRAADQR